MGTERIYMRAVRWIIGLLVVATSGCAARPSADYDEAFEMVGRVATPCPASTRLVAVAIERGERAPTIKETCR